VCTKSHSKWSQTLFVTTLTFVQKAFKKMIQKTNKKKSNKTSHAIYCKKFALSHDFYFYFSLSTHFIYIILAKKERK